MEHLYILQQQQQKNINTNTSLLIYRPSLLCNYSHTLAYELHYAIKYDLTVRK